MTKSLKADERRQALNTTDPYELMRAITEAERRARIEGKNEGLIEGYEAGLKAASKILDETLKEFSS